MVLITHLTLLPFPCCAEQYISRVSLLDSSLNYCASFVSLGGCFWDLISMRLNGDCVFLLAYLMVKLTGMKHFDAMLTDSVALTCGAMPINSFSSSLE